MILIIAFPAFPEIASDTLVSAGPFKRIYDPSIGETSAWYINDHCIIRGPDGWHMFGITHAEPFSPGDERNFAHATSPKLTGSPWNKQPYALTASYSSQESVLWAPHVVAHDSLYYMYYCAGGFSGNTAFRIHLATSRDCKTWTRAPENPMVVDGYDARDPMVVWVDSQWVMYYCATSAPTGGNHIVAARTSRDLTHWGDRITVYTDTSTGKGAGPTESPFVVKRRDRYYLFIGPRPDYVGTDVFSSDNPFHWDSLSKVGHIASHAAEVVRDTNGRWYVTSSGWAQGGLYLAPLIWHDGLDSEITAENLPVNPGSEEYLQVSPNPLRESGRAHFSLIKESGVRLSLYDLAGRRLKILRAGAYRKGRHSVELKTSGLPTGVYFIRMEKETGRTIQKRLLLIR